MVKAKAQPGQLLGVRATAVLRPKFFLFLVRGHSHLLA